MDSVTSPFGPLVIIANPRAGRGKVDNQLPAIERILGDAGLAYRIVRTTHPGHATTAAREALRGGERYLVAAGGDGTVHEVVNGMFEDGEPLAADAVLGIVAAGSGCDVVRSLGLPGDAVRASRHLAGDTVRDLDLGKVTFRSGSGLASRYFINIAEAGLGAAVVARTARLPRTLGPARYFCGFWLTLPGFHSSAVKLLADGRPSEWRAHNVVVANCRFYGGGMHISPNSKPDDGALDALVMVGPKTDAFTLLPRIYSGSHLPHRNIRELQASRVQLDAEPPVLVEADGEVLGTTPVTFEVVPRAVRVKVWSGGDPATGRAAR